MAGTLSEAELRGHLADVVGDERVSMRADDRDTYSRDMWPRALFAVRDGETALHPPDVIVWPETEDEVVRIVRTARRLRLPIVPYGAGSGVAGGAVPIHGGITVDMKRMNRVLEVDERELTVRAEAGVNGERFERELERRGYTLGHFPSSIYCSTLGGWLAARSAGQMSTRYGKIEDMALSMRAVTGRGELVEVGRRARAAGGPDWLQLLIGSEGTLGVITAAKLRIRPQPEVRHFRGFEMSSVSAGLEAIRRVLQRGWRPAVVRLYDEFDTMVHLRPTKKAGHTGNPDASHPRHGALPSLEGAADAPSAGLAGALTRVFSADGGKSVARELLGTALHKPRWLNAAAEALAPRLGRHGCLLILGVEGARARADVEAELVFGEVVRAGGKDLGEGPGQRWYAHRYAVSYNMSKVFESGAFVDTMEVASTWERLPDLYEQVKRAIGAHAFVMAHFSHAYSEGCSIYFSFVGHAPDRQAAEARYDAIWRDGLAASSRAGGTISHHHGVGLLKGPAMAEEHRESMAIYHALKQAFDPDGILNPGKMGLPVPTVRPWASITRS
jgi:alkyldihydroxyacetonephosphate synthase